MSLQRLDHVRRMLCYFRATSPLNNVDSLNSSIVRALTLLPFSRVCSSTCSSEMRGTSRTAKRQSAARIIRSEITRRVGGDKALKRKSSANTSKV